MNTGKLISFIFGTIALCSISSSVSAENMPSWEYVTYTDPMTDEVFVYAKADLGRNSFSFGCFPKANFNMIYSVGGLVQADEWPMKLLYRIDNGAPQKGVLVWITDRAIITGDHAAEVAKNMLAAKERIVIKLADLPPDVISADGVEAIQKVLEYCGRN